MTKKKLDWDRRLETLDGRDVVLLTRDYKSYDSPRCLVMFTSSTMSTLHIYLPDGSPVDEHCPPLRNKPRKVTKWYNLYAHRPGIMYMDYEETARKSTCDGKLPLATFPIEIEEPE